jgi:hypothetical protein
VTTRAAWIGLACGLALALTASYQAVWARSVVLPKFKVLPDSRVSVRVPAGAPLNRIRIAIHHLDRDPTPPNTMIAEAFTDETGHASFHGIKPGRYLMYAERGEIDGEAVKLEIEHSNALRKVVLGWPAQPIFKAEKISGTLVRAAIPGVPNFEKDVVLPRVQLTLTEVSSDRELGTTSTDDRGTFAFRDSPPGLYAMHIRWNGDNSGYILLEVNKTTKDAEPAVYSINPTLCGLGAEKR